MKEAAESIRTSHDEVRRDIKAKALKAAETGGAKEVRELNSLMHCEECGAGGAWEGKDLLSTGGGDQTWDDVQGGWLDPKLVAKARSDEMAYVRSHGVYVRVPRARCWVETGKAPICKTGWADTNKGTAAEPNIRSRRAAKEFNTGPRPDLFAGPLEGVRLVISEAASDPDPSGCIGIIDLRRAYFYAKTKRTVYVEVPVEDWQPGDEEMCGMLRMSLYGTRDAAQNWDEEL